MRPIALSLVLVTTMIGPGTGQTRAPSPQPSAAAGRGPLSRVEQEQFLLTARVSKVRAAKKGTAGTHSATLSDGVVTHEVSIQSIDESAARFQTATRVEFNFRDYWGYNVAAYRLAVMLGLDMVPPSVARDLRGTKAAYTWWVDGVMMDEEERVRSKRQPPDVVYWNAQNQILTVFDELIANTDRNGGNMLVDRQWKLWLIDHSRAFRTNEDLRNPVKLLHCDRALLAKLRTLTGEMLEVELGAYLTTFEMQAVLKRRDKIVARITALGPGALYDLRRPPS